MDLTQQLLKVFIEMYRERTCLWQTNSPDYRNRPLKMRAYQEIVQFLKEHGVPEASDVLVREKIQSMRRSVRKERDKIVRSNGSHKTRLWYYHAFDFIAGNDSQKLSTTTKDSKQAVKQETENSDSNESSDTDPLSDDPLQMADNLQDENNDTVRNHLSARSGPELQHFRGIDEFEALGIGVAAKVRRMDSRQRIFAELLIQKVLAKGLLGQLNESVEIVDLSCVRKPHTCT